MSKKIVTLYSDKEKTNELLPRTKTQAITNSSDVNLDTILSNKQDKVSSATDKVASFNSSGQVENSGITKSDVAQVVSEWKTIEEIKNNQEFNYREVPVSYDGTGTITRIKGNTVKFNQLMQNGNFADTSGWTYRRCTAVANNNRVTITPSENDPYVRRTLDNIVVSHKYYFSVHVFSGDLQLISYFGDFNLVIGKNSFVGNALVNTFLDIRPKTSTDLSVFSFSNVMVVDLTLMGIDNLTTVEQVETWLSNNIGLLPYYDYTQGSLISFNGTGLKTTGKNLLNDEYENGDFIFYLPSGTYYYRRFLLTSKSDISTRLQAEINGTYTYLQDTDSADGGGIVTSGNMGWGIDARQTITLTRGYYFKLESNIITNIIPGIAHLILCTGSYADDYEPYTSNTLSLPISTYFPTGMKSAGEVYDELTESKAITRVGMVNLDNFTWDYNTDYQMWVSSTGISDSAPPRYLINANIPSQLIGTGDAPRQGSFINATYNIWVRNGSDTVKPSGVAYYILETPTSQDISLDLTYPVYRGGTEQLLPVNGATPTTSNIICDIDYRNEAKVRQDNTDKITDIVDDIDTINSNISNVVNTGDSDTPVENGTDKFTTGGAYDLKSLIDSKQDIYYGTTMPSSSMGNDGDVFILYS